MNRDTLPDIPDQTAHGANVMACDQSRRSQDRLHDLKMHAATNAATNETNKDTHEGRSTRAENKSSVLHPATSSANPRSFPSSGELRRNLYVLGLPFDLTKSEFAKIFEPYGTVTHAVILATLDSASRRRGFVVMSSHQEAKVAMDTLSRTQIKGHVLDVSWAVVQRSQGFLDGADRSMMLAISPPISESHKPFPTLNGPEDHKTSGWELTHMPTSRLLVSNISTMLFTQVTDLHPLFYPFGPIKDIRILGSLNPGALDATITAMVEYVNVSNAQEAKEALQCQSYAGHPIGVHYICDAGAPVHARPSLFPSSVSGHGKFSDIGLNPFAIPFINASRFSPATQGYNLGYNAAVPSGLTVDTPISPQPFPAHMRPYMMDSISRSSSATSSTWSHDSRSRMPHSSFNSTNPYASYV